MVGLIIIAALLAIISWAWVKGISDMDKNNPEYKGEELKKYNDWDDNHFHTEQGL